MNAMPNASQTRSRKYSAHVEDAWGVTVTELQASRIASTIRPPVEGKEDSDDGCSDAVMDELSLSELAFWMDYDDLEPSNSINGEILLPHFSSADFGF